MYLALFTLALAVLALGLLFRGLGRNLYAVFPRGFSMGASVSTVGLPTSVPTLYFPPVMAHSLKMGGQEG